VAYVLRSTEQHAKQKDHKMFCHWEHPLGEEDPFEMEQTNKRRIRGNASDIIADMEIEGEEDKIYQGMLKIGSEFYDEFQAKKRSGETMMLQPEAPAENSGGQNEHIDLNTSATHPTLSKRREKAKQPLQKTKNSTDASRWMSLLRRI
jgi:hypothetical protein